MARDVVTYTWCDICLGSDEGERVEGSEVVMAVGQMKPRVLALCPGHMKEVFEPLRDLLLTMPIAGDTPTPGRASQTESVGDFPCTVCGKQYKYKQSLRNHLRETHSMTLTQMREKHAQGPGLGDLELRFGDDEKAPDDEKRPAVTRAECDQPGCDKVFEWPKNMQPIQALGVHKAKAHGIRSPKHQRKVAQSA